MIAALFAVAMLGGGEVPILHAPQFADAHALAHQHVDHAAPGYHDHVPADRRPKRIKMATIHCNTPIAAAPTHMRTAAAPLH